MEQEGQQGWGAAGTQGGRCYVWQGHPSPGTWKPTENRTRRFLDRNMVKLNSFHKTNLSSIHSKPPPFLCSNAEANTEHLGLRHEMVCCGLKR